MDPRGSYLQLSVHLRKETADLCFDWIRVFGVSLDYQMHDRLLVLVLQQGMDNERQRRIPILDHTPWDILENQRDPHTGLRAVLVSSLAVNP